MSKYRFGRLTSADIQRELGLSVRMTVRKPSLDDEGNYLADMEIDFGKHVLSVQDERKLEELMNAQGLTCRRGQPNDE